MKRSIEEACLDQAWFNPESVATLEAFQAVAWFQLLYPRPQVFDIGALNKSVKGGNPFGSPNKDLNTAGMANDVRLGFLGLLDQTRTGAYRAREHLLSA
ncbi:MAG TPA: hypothetical protein VOA64_13290 [Candidatus Dormibacteraeota bacterium]|nr:hypothetical protein [Candidatus Dormibacteraeota bacterium]